MEVFNFPPPQDCLLSDFIIDQFAAERKLSQINAHKVPGPDGLPNWILHDFCNKHLFQGQCALSSTHRFVKVLCLQYGKRLM